MSFARPTEPDDELQSLLERVRDRERTALKRSIVYSLIPIVIAGLVLGIISWQAQQRIQELASAQRELARVNMRIRSATEEITAIEGQLLEEVFDLTEKAAIFNNTGRLYQDLGEYDLALQNYRQALDIYREVGDREREEAVLFNIKSLEPPTATDILSTVAVGGEVSITLQGSDAETCELTFIISSAPTSGTLSPITDQPCTEGGPNSDTAILTYTHDGSDTTSDSFTYQVCDDATPQQCATATVSITIHRVD